MNFTVQWKLHTPKCTSVPDAWWRKHVEAGLYIVTARILFTTVIYLFDFFFLWAKHRARSL